MKASRLLKIIQEELKDYPIEYLKNKATDARYHDPLAKKLAKYNSQVYDEIYKCEIKEDHTIEDKLINNIKGDINYYFTKYAGEDTETREFTKYITLYLALIAKKPLHPYSENKKDDVYIQNDIYYCKGRIKYIKDKKSLCKYCTCKNVGFQRMYSM